MLEKRWTFWSSINIDRTCLDRDGFGSTKNEVSCRNGITFNWIDWHIDFQRLRSPEDTEDNNRQISRRDSGQLILTNTNGARRNGSLHMGNIRRYATSGALSRPSGRCYFRHTANCMEIFVRDFPSDWPGAQGIFQETFNHDQTGLDRGTNQWYAWGCPGIRVI